MLQIGFSRLMSVKKADLYTNNIHLYMYAMFESQFVKLRESILASKLLTSSWIWSESLDSESREQKVLSASTCSRASFCFCRQARSIPMTFRTSSLMQLMSEPLQFWSTRNFVCASCKGLYPWQSDESTSVPAINKSVTTDILLVTAAKCNGVLPMESR